MDICRYKWIINGLHPGSCYHIISCFTSVKYMAAVRYHQVLSRMGKPSQIYYVLMFLVVICILLPACNHPLPRGQSLVSRRSGLRVTTTLQIKWTVGHVLSWDREATARLWWCVDHMSIIYQLPLQYIVGLWYELLHCWLWCGTFSYRFVQYWRV